MYRLPGYVFRDHFIELLRTERPETCHWVGLDVIIRHFAEVINGFDTVALQTVLGRHWQLLLMQNFGFVSHGRNAVKRLYVQGQLCHRSLNDEMALCDDLNAHLASVQLIVTLHYGSKAAIVAAGGAADMGRALLEFRQDTMLDLCVKHEAVIGKATKHTAEKALAGVALDFYSLDFPINLIVVPLPLLWRDISTGKIVPDHIRPSESEPSLCSAAGINLLGDFMSSLPQERTDPALPTIFRDLDPLSLDHKPRILLVEYMLAHLREISQFRDSLGDPNDPENRTQELIDDEVADYIWRTCKLLLQSTCLLSPFWGKGSPSGLKKSDLVGLYAHVARRGGNDNASRNACSNAISERYPRSSPH